MQAFEGLLVHDDAGDRRPQGESARGTAGALQARELVGRDIPVLEPRERRIGNGPGVVARHGIGVRHLGRCRPGDEILALRQHQIGAVNLKQGLAAPDGLAGRVDEQLLDPPLEFRIDDADAALVGRHGADRPHRMRHAAAGDGFGAHAEHLDALGTDGDRARNSGAALVGINRDVVHPHGILLRHRRGVGQAHGIAVVENPALATRCRRRGRCIRRRRCGAGILIDRNVVVALRVFLGRRRIIGLAGWILVIERLPFLRPCVVPGAGQRDQGQQDGEAGRGCAAHRSPPISRSIAASWRC
jgi:hypothetical protein